MSRKIRFALKDEEDDIIDSCLANDVDDAWDILAAKRELSVSELEDWLEANYQEHSMDSEFD